MVYTAFRLADWLVWVILTFLAHLMCILGAFVPVTHVNEIHCERGGRCETMILSSKEYRC